MSEDSQKDRWIAAAACLAIAALLVLASAWAAQGVAAVMQDYQRFEADKGGRLQRDLVGTGLWLFALAAFTGLGALGMLGLAVWIPLARRPGAARRRRRDRGTTCPPEYATRARR